ncbi:MAG: hypothetical protein CV087_23805 [Candidatus Brocadia sp. WS118]|nr:MAG: hypothetical protein CV087_23805 [Candidatus Brocadia sp. WS118]
MRILDIDADKRIDRLTLYLTRHEAEELKNDLFQIIENPIQNHLHISSDDYKKELTICIYDENLRGFDERSKKLILEDI